MEGITRRGLVAGAILCCAGLAINIQGFAPRNRHNEAWVAAHAPVKVGTYFMSPVLPGETVSYHMDKSSYDVLRPYGIVCRAFTNGQHSYDTVVIASNSKESFHDPKQCFSSQGNDLTNERIVDIPTQTRGIIPVTFVELKGPHQDSVAAYLYKGPDGFQATNRGIKLSMFLSQLKSGKAPEGVFFRFIAQDGDVNAFKGFIGQFLDASSGTSSGLF